MSEPRSHRIWIVDDVALELEASRRALAPKFAVEVFSDGSTVLERAVSGDLPDVLVLDWHMEGVGGLEVLKFLRSQEATVGLPILVFTATGDRGDLLDALQAGADDYVDKSSSDEELAARVNTLIRANGLRERAERAEAELEQILGRERVARAEAEEANRAKDLFLATVSHELRNPLSAILGWARMLKGGTLDPAHTARAIETIERNAVAQVRMIDDLFDVARIVAGNLSLDLAPVDLTRAIEHAIETTRPAAAAKKIRIEAYLSPCEVLGDVARLQQVALNLLSNAVKFTEPGGTVHVSLRPAGDQVILTVRDTGPGIAPDLLPHVFDRFRQGDASITRRHAGLGLGLAIVRQLVELHHGNVIARNDPAGGALLEVRLPAVALGSTEAVPAAQLAPRNELEGLTVLVIEDDRDGLALLTAVLVDRGATVIQTASAEEALTYLGARTPDLIVSDIAMEGHDGYWLMREIRRSLPGDRLPAIAVTALARDADRADALGAGFQRHLTKPLDTEDLVLNIVSLTAAQGRR